MGFCSTLLGASTLVVILNVDCDTGTVEELYDEDENDKEEAENEVRGTCNRFRSVVATCCCLSTCIARRVWGRIWSGTRVPFIQTARHPAK